MLRPERIIAVDLTVKPSHRAPSYRPHAIATLFRAFDIVENVISEQMLHMHVSPEVALIQPKLADMDRFDFDRVHDLVQAGESEAMRVLTSHPATRTSSCGDGSAARGSPAPWSRASTSPSTSIPTSASAARCVR